MITENELSAVRNFLLTKKLPIDILLEVQDHFISQISQMMRDKDIDFTTAFEQVKEIWRKDLQPYWKGEMNLEDTSDFMRRIKKEIDFANLRFALQWGWIPVIVIWASANLFPDRFFGWFIVVLLASLLLFTASNYLFNLKEFRLARKYPNHILTLHQQSVIFFLVLGPFFSIFSDFVEKSKSIRSILLWEEGIFKFIMVLLPIVIVSYSCFFSLSAQKNYLRQIQKVKPFLKYLS